MNGSVSSYVEHVCVISKCVHLCSTYSVSLHIAAKHIALQMSLHESEIILLLPIDHMGKIFQIKVTDHNYVYIPPPRRVQILCTRNCFVFWAHTNGTRIWQTTFTLNWQFRISYKIVE
jgi:hypothetical protein